MTDAYKQYHCFSPLQEEWQHHEVSQSRGTDWRDTCRTLSYFTSTHVHNTVNRKYIFCV